MTKVIIIEPPNSSLDVSSADEHGEVIYLFDYSTPRASIWSDDFKHDLIDRLKEVRFNPEKDVFVVVGHMVTVVLAVTTILTVYGRLNALFYSSTERKYVVRELNVKDTTYD